MQSSKRSVFCPFARRCEFRTLHRNSHPIFSTELQRRRVSVRKVWFHQDGTTSHTARASMDVLCQKFPGRLISHFGDILLPPRSPDLSICDSFVGSLKIKSLSMQATNPWRIEERDHTSVGWSSGTNADRRDRLVSRASAFLHCGLRASYDWRYFQNLNFFTDKKTAYVSKFIDIIKIILLKLLLV